MDRIDLKLLGIVEHLSGSPVGEVCKLARETRSDNRIRARLNKLEEQGFVAQDRTTEAGRVFVSITESGKAVLEDST